MKASDIAKLTVQVSHITTNPSAYPDYVDDSPSPPPEIVTLEELLAHCGPYDQWLSYVNAVVPNWSKSKRREVDRWDRPTVESVAARLTQNDIQPWSAPGFSAFEFETYHRYGDLVGTRFSVSLNVRTGSGSGQLRTLFLDAVEQ